MSVKVITLNGTNFYPTNIERTKKRIATVRRMVDGTLKTYHRTYKSEWSITWDNLPEGSLAAIQTISELNTSFAFVDEFSTSFTVMATPDDFSYSFDAGDISIGGTIYYSATLTLHQI